MQLMEHTFIVLQYIGLWHPVHWQPGWKTKLYHSYTSIMIFVMIIGTFSILVAVINSTNDKDFAANIFNLLSIILDVGKAVNILIKRREIIELKNVLQQDPCQPKNEQEFVIQRKFDLMIRSITLRYCVLVSSGASTLIWRPLVQNLPRGSLPYQSWFPFDYNKSRLGYTVAYAIQTIIFYLSCAIGVAFDTLLPGLMLQTCAQLNILKRRFHDMPQLVTDNTRDINKLNLSISTLESKLLSQRVKHHLKIFKFAETSNDIFSFMIFLQCTISTGILSMSLLRMTKLKVLSPEFVVSLMCIAIMSTQLFLFCFYGGQVTYESLTVADAIYETDWCSFSVNARRSLLTIMARTLRSIEFVSGHIVTLNLESFNNLVKISYSAFNLFQQFRE